MSDDDFYNTAESDEDWQRHRQAPTIYKTDEQCQREADDMIYHHKMSLVDDFGRMAGMLWTIILLFVFPTVLCGIFVWIADAIGFIDKITSKINMLP